LADWKTVKIVSSCSPAAAGEEILFPKGSEAPAKRLLVKPFEGSDGDAMVLSPGVRSDNGTAACVSGSALSALGGANATVSYRELSFLGVLRRNGWLTLQLVIVVLSLAGALIGAYGTWIKSSGEPSGFANGTAVVVFAISALLALTKFLKEYREI
jgi:hypothetical protein